MSDDRLTPNQLARFTFALELLERNRAAVDAAILALRQVAATQDDARLAEAAAKKVLEEVAASDVVRATALKEDKLARLGLTESETVAPAQPLNHAASCIAIIPCASAQESE